MIRPDFGANYCTCVLLTDAPLSPTPPESLPDSFDPCAECHLCAEVCLSKAIESDVNPPACYYNERCGRYVQGKLSVHGVIEAPDVFFVIGEIEKALK